MNEGSHERNSFLTVSVLFFFLFLSVPFMALGQEKITDYTVTITVHNDSSIKVLEEIRYDFGEALRRGIYRDIPTVYDTTVGKRSIRLEIENVTRDGFPEEYSEQRSRSDTRLKIGNPDITMSGEHVYRFTYTVSGAFNAFKDYDELYWNAIPHNWTVPIERTKITVSAPVPPREAACFRGGEGSQDTCNPIFTGENTIEIIAGELSSHEGVTVALSFPKGVLMLPAASTKVLWWFRDNYIIFLPFLVFLIMFRVWREKGKDVRGTGTIIPHYEPPLDITPVFLGSLIDGTLHNTDITAGILYLAEQGHIVITRVEQKRFLRKDIDYILEWVGTMKDLDKQEQLVAEFIFELPIHRGKQTTLSELQKDTKLAARRKRLKEYIDRELKRKGYFANRPHKTREMWGIIAGIAGIPVVILFAFNLLYAVTFLISGIIIAWFGMLMPKMTKQGARMNERILGFKDFLSVTQKERLAFHNAPERTPTEFMRFLPFAIALGVEKKWGEQFSDTYVQNPPWYRGGSFKNYAATAFVSDFSGFTTSLNTSMSAAQGSSGTSGGGFSGGGMGGGGGGSW